MLAQTWPPVTYWLTADDRLIATAIELLEEQAAAYDPERELEDE